MKQTGAFVLAAMIATAGCTKSHVQDTLRAPLGKNIGEAVTVLPPRSVLGDDADMADCVRWAMQSESPRLQFVLRQEFRGALFPWFEPGTAPQTQKELASLLNKPFLRERIDKLGLRYLIYVSGGTVQEEFEGFLTGGAGGNAGFLIGYGSADRVTEISATIWDLRDADSLGTVDIEKTGTVRVGVFIIVPFLIPTSTEAPACSEIGKRLVDILSGDGSQADSSIESSP